MRSCHVISQCRGLEAPLGPVVWCPHPPPPAPPPTYCTRYTILTCTHALPRLSVCSGCSRRLTSSGRAAPIICPRQQPARATGHGLRFDEAAGRRAGEITVRPRPPPTRVRVRVRVRGRTLTLTLTRSDLHRLEHGTERHHELGEARVRLPRSIRCGALRVSLARLLQRERRHVECALGLADASAAAD